MGTTYKLKPSPSTPARIMERSHFPQRHQLRPRFCIGFPCGSVLNNGSERVAEWRQAVLAASLPEAGLSWASPQKPKRTTKGAERGLGIVIPEKNCTRCVAWEALCLWDLEGCTRSCRLCQQLKKPCRRFEGLSEKGKWRVEDKGEGEGPSKRPRVGLSLE